MNKFLLVLMLVSVSPAFAEGRHVWQESASAVVTLGVRDKFADERDSSTVTFVVVSQDGHDSYKITRATFGDAFLYVKFPQDFTDRSLVGSFTWTALVDGKKIAGGSITNEY
ncbi:MAG: hypothetical protein ACXVB9_12975 [Bdellovibrionota bacterium]